MQSMPSISLTLPLMQSFPYQTAYLKYYYPVEFMAALMTSVVEMPNKVAEIYFCMPPGWGSGSFRRISIMVFMAFLLTAKGENVRYALSAIKSIGHPVIEGIVREREEHGEYTSLKAFIERNIGPDQQESCGKSDQGRSAGLPGGKPESENDGLYADHRQYQPG